MLAKRLGWLYIELALLLIFIEIGGLLGGKTDVVFLWDGMFRGEIPWIEF